MQQRSRQSVASERALLRHLLLLACQKVQDMQKGEGLSHVSVLLRLSAPATCTSNLPDASRVTPHMRAVGEP
jgi:hypothetical protein